MTSTRPYPLLSRCLAPRSRYNEAKLRAVTTGQRVLITGASRGIGEALALRLAHEGVHLCLLARHASTLGEVAAQAEARGASVSVFCVDLSDPASVSEVAERLSREAPFDLVVHNAGKSIRRLLVDSLQRHHDFERCMQINYLGPVKLQLALLPPMMRRKRGHLINISSVGVRLPSAPRWAAYTASKSAFELWVSAAEPELRRYGLLCSTIYFGLVHTQMSAPTEKYQSMPGLSAEEAAGVICRAIISKRRVVQPWWLALIAWLALPLKRPLEWLFQLTLGPAPALPSEAEVRPDERH